MMFVEHNTGKAKAAMNFYTSIFKNSSIKGVLEYAKEKEEKPGYVKHAQFQLNDFMLSCMESSVAHQFNFTEAVSLVVLTQDQEETDYLWNSLIAEGGKESKCGWLKDQYGVSWQIIPKKLLELKDQENQEKAQKVVQAMLKMEKIDISKLEKANQS
ncbi:VOC family protein [Mesonia sp. MT50]|uniref:VOC family protein n=1 Tax=Mesonia profundi TaxID=3070998 RepID=A0ABU1A4R2_9FLAO|nr:VOC family protein [Mesonia profundi]MDQ7918657.1 VOC family protein [Mesonia profundi]